MADHNWDFGLRSLQVKLQGLGSVVYLRFLLFHSIKWSLIYELWQGFQLSQQHITPPLNRASSLPCIF